METLARWSFRNRRLVVVLWVVAVVAIAGLGRLIPADYRVSDSLPNTDSSTASQLLQREFPDQAGEVDSIVWKVTDGTVRDPDVRERMGRMLAAVDALPHVAGVQSPYATGGERAISANGRIAFASVRFDQDGDDLAKDTVLEVIDTAQEFATPKVSVDLGGYAVAQATMTISTSVSELVGVLAAAVVLWLAFGSLLAVSLPLVCAIASVIPAVALIGMVSRVMTVPSFASSLTILLNLGVGIDYALFLVTRQRRGLLAGRSIEDALVETLRTAGRSVLFAGTVICHALLGLFSLGVDYLSGMAAASVIGILFTMAAALTLLPALLGFFGERLFSRRERRRAGAGEGDRAPDSRGWIRWAGLVERRPLVFAVAATLVTVVLALPLLSLRLGFSDQGNDPPEQTTRQAYDALSEGFGPGFNAPLLVVISADGRLSDGALRNVNDAMAATPGVASVTPARVSPSGEVAVQQVFPKTSPQSERTKKLLHHLRDDVTPEAVRGTGAAVYIGGFTATEVDFTDTISARLPLFIGVVVLLGALLLLIAFRSLLVAALTAVMNLFAIGVCFGVIVAVFQWGWLSGVTGIGETGPIDAYLPVFLFAILFGLSMDYQVFLLGRMHETWVHTRDSRRSVTLGQVETGRVITVAAAIMVLVFLSFASGEREMKLFGIGMGVTVLFDAFVIRTMLVPAVLHLAGRASWWLPGPLDRLLPRLEVAERETAAVPPQEAGLSVVAGPADSRPHGNDDHTN
ncbi:MMPL family transporter [Streptomyces acidiscabies]|uniref:MMPL family transporter n=1 Tax=Streptomyces acidiscabies TaxID=42234 RepID=UPI000951EEBD|nr:MMPL family transporter [Streptomyces acidiscabies]